MKDLTEAAREFVDALNLTRSKGSQKWMADLMAQFGQQQIDKALAAFVRLMLGELELYTGMDRENIETVAEACRRVAEEQGVEIK